MKITLMDAWNDRDNRVTFCDSNVLETNIQRRWRVNPKRITILECKEYVVKHRGWWFVRSRH